MEAQKRLVNFAYASLLILWTLCILGLWFSLAKSKTLLTYEMNGRVIMADFVEYYQVGTMALKEQSHAVYDPSVQMHWTNELIYPLHIDRPHFIQYSPIVFPLMIPFSLIPMRISYYVWGLTTMCFGISALVFLVRSTSSLNKTSTALLLAGVLASCPAWEALRTGQISWLLLGIVSLYAWAFLKNRHVIAGITLALSAVKPQYSLFLLLPPLIYKRWQVVASAAITGLLLLIITGEIIGWQNIFNYVHVVLSKDVEDTGVLPELMMCYRSVFSWFESKSIALQLSLATMLAGIAVMSWLLFINRTNEEKTKWALALSILFSLILSPHTHFYDYLLLAVCAALSLESINLFTRQRTMSLRIWKSILVSMPVWSWIAMVCFLPLNYAVIGTACILIITTILMVAGFYIVIDSTSKGETPGM